MKVAFDYDDVIADFMGRVIQTVNKEYGSSLSEDDFASWDLSETLDAVIGHDWWEWWEKRPWLWGHVDAIDGAIGGLETLHREGHYIEIVTAKPDWARVPFNRWLHAWNPYYDAIIIGEARPPMKKHWVSEAKLLIDDKPGNVRDWIASSSLRGGLLFARPHNRSEREEFEVANDWKEVVAWVRSYAS